jgi:hypothetical protein
MFVRQTDNRQFNLGPPCAVGIILSEFPPGASGFPMGNGQSADAERLILNA